MDNHFDDETQHILRRASAECWRNHGDQVGTEYLLLGVLGGTGAAAALLGTAISTAAVRGRLPRGGGGPNADLPFSPRAQRALDHADAIRERCGTKAVSAAHLLLALLDQDRGQPLERSWWRPYEPSWATQILRDLKVDIETLRGQTIPLAQAKFTSQGGEFAPLTSSSSPGATHSSSVETNAPVRTRKRPRGGTER